VCRRSQALHRSRLGGGCNVNQFALRERLKNMGHKLGFDILRYPSTRLISGQIATVLRDLKINCVLDVGARYGEYGAFLRSIGYTDHIISFEPVAESYAKLEKLAASDPKWHTVRKALGAVDGTIPINVANSTVFSSFRQANANGPAVFQTASQTVRQEDVSVCRLEHVFGTVTEGIPNPRVYLKLDTQGWDIEVLKGADSTINSVLAMQSEISVRPVYTDMPDYVESLATLQTLGFEPVGFFPVSYDGVLSVIEFDCVLIRQQTREP
jgi:FkbM family methyltransferase